MKKIKVFLLFFLFHAVLFAQTFVANYDESKVPQYTLPDPVIFNNGSKVSSLDDWELRRAEIFHLFENEVFGIASKWNGKIVSTKISQNDATLGGLATRSEIKLTLKNEGKEISFMVLLYLPHSKKPVPLFVGYNFDGNQTITEEPDVEITTSWVQNKKDLGVTENKSTDKTRGTSKSRWPVKEIISRGYGLATIYYGDCDPDFDDGFKNGIHALFEQKRDSSSWGSIAAWAWGLSRVMDYFETNKSIDSEKVIVIGHSRLGKAALWAGSTDQRFAIVVSNNSGCGGAALSRRVFGETVGRINRSFPHWFCDNFKKYNENEGALPVDQHELIALIAPRPVYVASAEEDLWADPKGEFLSCVAATPVYKLFGLKGLPATEMPTVNNPVIGEIGYHIRPGKHDITLYDWQRYMDFADLHFQKKN